jgi:hypothetical protein
LIATLQARNAYLEKEKAGPMVAILHDVASSEGIAVVKNTSKLVHFIAVLTRHCFIWDDRELATRRIIFAEFPSVENYVRNAPRRLWR